MTGDFFDSFRPVDPAPGEHYWSLVDGGTSARCTRCGLRLEPRLDQLQAGRAVGVALVIAGSGVRWPSSKHRRCTS